jgi:hypothetical protein
MLEHIVNASGAECIVAALIIGGDGPIKEPTLCCEIFAKHRGPMKGVAYQVRLTDFDGPEPDSVVGETPWASGAWNAFHRWENFTGEKCPYDPRQLAVLAGSMTQGAISIEEENS